MKRIASFFLTAAVALRDYTALILAYYMHRSGLILHNMQQSFPDLKTFRDYMVNRAGVSEVIRQSLYDSAVYPAAGIAGNLTFFQQPVGAGVSSSPGNAANAKTIADTNMTLAGQLPAPQGFWIQSIELDFQPGATTGASWVQTIPTITTPTFAAANIGGPINDVSLFYSAGQLTLTVGTKPYLQEAPLLYFPPKARFEQDEALSGVRNGTSAVINAMAVLKAGGRPYILEPGIPLMTSQNFNVTLFWPNAVATNSGFPGRVMCKMDGWLFRAVQ